MIDSFNWLKKGSIIVITGPMFAGKTDELIRILNVFHHARKQILVFQPLATVRTANKEISSHDQRVFPAQIINDTKAIVQAVQKAEKKQQVDIIAFDETQFLDLELFPYLQQWAQAGKIILCAGLDKDYYGEYDGLMSRLLVAADFVKKLWAICGVCHGVATHTQRMAGKKAINCYYPKMLIGGKGHYQARCKNCYLSLKD